MRNVTTQAKSIMALSILAAAVGHVNAGEPAKLTAGIIDFIPTLDVSESYNDNIYSASSNETSSNILVISPELRAEINSGDSSYSLTAAVDDGSYSEGSDDDYTDYNIAADANIAFNHRNKLSFGASISENHEARGSGATEGTSGFNKPTEYDKDILFAGYQLGGDDATMRLELAAENVDTDYTNFKTFTRFRSFEKESYGATAFYKLAPKTDLFVEIGTADFEYDVAVRPASALDSTEDKVLVGVTWEATANTTGSIKAGRLEKEFDSSTRGDFTGNIWAADVSWTPSDNTTVNVFTSQAPRETSSNGNFVDGELTGASWIQNWSESISTNVNVSIGDDQYDGSIREDDTTNYGISLDYEFRRWMQVGLSYDYTETDSNQNTFDFETNVYSLYVTLSL